MRVPLTLPTGLTQRPLVMADAPAVAELMAEQERHDVGQAAIDEADIVGDWQRPSFDVASSTIGVLDGERLVAYGEVTNEVRGDAGVLPAYRRRGLGTAIATWMQETARSRGLVSLETQVLRGTPSDALLAALGYVDAWTAWELALPAGARLPVAEPPPGVTVRAALPAEYEACWRLQDAAFLEWSERAPSSYEDWAARVVRRPGFAPWNLRVAVDGDGAVSGVAVVVQTGDTGHLDRLAVPPEHRGRGLGLALLCAAFAAAAEHGSTEFGLATDSRSGALGLYERAGLEVTSNWVTRRKTL